MSEEKVSKNIKNRLVTADDCASIPMKWVGPMLLTGDIVGQVSIPLATYESPLWPSVERGARVTAKSGGINVSISDHSMTRSIAVQAESAKEADNIRRDILASPALFQEAISESSKFARFIKADVETLGPILYIRLALNPGDASGHNMATKAAEKALDKLLNKYALKYISLSGNYCSDKKVSAVNSILGRGIKVSAEAKLSAEVCKKMLRVTPAQIAELNTKKNLLGSIAAGSLRSANAHYANILLAAYLATGQDAANIVEGSQGITFAEVQGDELYFSVTLPNLIVGTVGNGKELSFVKDNLEKLGCSERRETGANSERLAGIIAAAVLCGELSLLAALANPGELVKTHMKLER